MPVNLSIKSVPDALVAQLKERAEKNHRSLQGELMTILEASVHRPKLLTPEEAINRLRAMRLSTSSESVDLLRKERDER